MTLVVFTGAIVLIGAAILVTTGRHKIRPILPSGDSATVAEEAGA